MTPAEELRAAAAKLRKRGREATPGPWHRPLDVRNKDIVTAAKPDDEQGRYLDGRPERVGVVQCNTWSNGAHFRKRSGRDLEWIALANPLLAEPLAAWLGEFADWHDASHVVGLNGVMHECGADDCTCFTSALAVARVINGGAS